MEAESTRESADRFLREYLLLEDRIEEAMLVACDLYVESRQRIDEVRINEVKAREASLSRLLRAVEATEGERP